MLAEGEQLHTGPMENYPHIDPSELYPVLHAGLRGNLGTSKNM